jgi:hypothetical protein
LRANSAGGTPASLSFSTAKSCDSVNLDFRIPLSVPFGESGSYPFTPGGELTAPLGRRTRDPERRAARAARGYGKKRLGRRRP